MAEVEKENEDANRSKYIHPHLDAQDAISVDQKEQLLGGSSTTTKHYAPEVHLNTKKRKRFERVRFLVPPGEIRHVLHDEEFLSPTRSSCGCIKRNDDIFNVFCAPDTPYIALDMKERVDIIRLLPNESLEEPWQYQSFALAEKVRLF
jgi:hypothetical protein